MKQVVSVLEKLQRDHSLLIRSVEKNSGGRNYGSYSVFTDGSPLVLKVADPRALSGSLGIAREVQFLQWANRTGISKVPTLFAYSIGQAWVAETRLPGSGISALEDWHMIAAANFVQTLWDKRREGLPSLLPAKDRLFDGRRFGRALSGRITSFQKQLSLSGYEICYARDAAGVLGEYRADRMAEDLRELDALIGKFLRRFGSLDIVSPSDFGFHNALQTLDSNRTLSFFDFEYAGRDNLVKLLMDFMCQVDHPLTTKNQEMFLRSLGFGLVLERSDITAGVWRLFIAKWTLIRLKHALASRVEVFRRDHWLHLVELLER